MNIAILANPTHLWPYIMLRQAFVFLDVNMALPHVIALAGSQANVRVHDTPGRDSRSSGISALPILKDEHGGWVAGDLVEEIAIQELFDPTIV